MFAVFAMIAVDPVSAGEAVADLSIDAAVQPTGVTAPGTEGIVTITITNLGPDTGSAIFTMLRTNDGTALSFPPLEFSGPTTGPCGFIPPGQPGPGQSIGIFGHWSTLNMAPGERRDCTFGFEVLETTKTSQIGRWAVSTTSGADDPNDTNNVSEVLLRFTESPEPVSVPILSPWAVVILAFLLGLIAPSGLAKCSKSSASSY